MTKPFAATGVLLGIAALAACSGGGTSPPPNNPGPTPTPTATATATATPPPAQQVISVALPTTSIGRVTDPTFGLVGGYTQSTFSQVLGFVPGTQIMIRNADSSRPHTLGDIGTQSFPSGQPASLSPVATNSTTFSAGWQSGNLNSLQMVGPITLSAGTYYIGCAYHYASDTMRDVLVVAANAVPGPQATPAPGATMPPPGGGGGGY